MERPCVEQSQQILHRQPLFGPMGACNRTPRPMRSNMDLNYCVCIKQTKNGILTAQVLMSCLGLLRGPSMDLQREGRGGGGAREKIKQQIKNPKFSRKRAANLPAQRWGKGDSAKAPSRISKRWLRFLPRKEPEIGSCGRISTRGRQPRSGTSGEEKGRKDQLTQNLTQSTHDKNPSAHLFILFKSYFAES